MLIKQDILVLSAILLVAPPVRADEFASPVSSIHISPESIAKDSIPARQSFPEAVPLAGQYGSTAPLAANPYEEPPGKSSVFLSGRQDGLLWKLDEGRPSLNYKFSDHGPVVKLRGSKNGARVIATWGF